MRKYLYTPLIGLVVVLAACGSSGGGSAGSAPTQPKTTRPPSTADACRAAFQQNKENGIWSDKVLPYKDTLTACETVNTWQQVAAQLGVPTYGTQGSNTKAANLLDDAMCPTLQSFETPVCQDAASINRP